MAHSLIVVFLGVLLTLVGKQGYCQSQSTQQADEIHVLIDVSGSMKQNDPQNMRVDATQLLINLLPDGSKASLWLFAEKPKLLTHSDSIDANWRQQAVKLGNKINSRGVYTDIEAAIGNAMQNGFAGTGQKHLIILTDGMVDISRDIMISADSRERILSEWIPKLQQQQIKVQTIALSGQADKELLEKLALDTGGWTETPESADQLQRVFLKMAQKAAPKDSLPLNDNRFNVDSGVKEFSVLVFKKPQAAPTKLIAPDGKKIDKLSTAASWLETTGYDLITVKQPQTGEWQIEAAVDPDNQVMILTDLKLQIQEPPNFIDEKQSLPIKVHFTEQGNIINRTDFLSLISLSLSVDHQAAIQIQPVKDEAGFFAYTVPEMAHGKHNLTLTADAKTFKRELQRDVEILAVPISVEKSVDSEKREVTVKLQPDIAILDTATLNITAIVSQTGKEPVSHVISGNDGAWTLKLDALPAGSSAQVNFNIIAKTLDGKSVSPALMPIGIDDSTFKSAPAEPTHDEHHAPAADLTNDEQHMNAAAEPHQPAESPPSENHWGITLGIVFGVNILAIGLGFFVYKAIKKANAAKQQQLLERLA